ncbi:MAG TPA: hypothetical protein VGM44_12845 [Polyangiaceae bacterium]
MSLPRRIRTIWAALRKPGALRVLYQGVTFAPRLVVNFAAVAALAGMLGACVPATQYEEAKSASEVELAGRKRAEAELADARSKLEAANTELSERDQKLAATQETVSESKLENTVALKERDEATGLVDQLRGELARVGDDLRSYATQKSELEKSLAATEAKQKEAPPGDAHAIALARLMRDLTAALGDRVLSGDVEVDIANGKVVVSAPSELWFADDAKLISGADGLIAGITRVLALRTDTSLEVTPPGAGELAGQRAQALVSAISAKGVDASRIKTDLVTPDDDGKGPSAEVTLAFSVK